MQFLKLLIVVVSVLLAACVKNPFRQPSDYLDFREIEFSRSVGECQDDSMPCAQIKLVFPEAYQGDLGLVNTLNTTIYAALIEGFHPESPVYNEPPDLGQLADTFLQDYQDFLLEFPDYKHPWEISVTGEIIFETSKIISIRLNSFSFTGGAHPNSNVTLFSFNANTGQVLRYQDVVSDMDAFTAQAESEFRMVRKLDQQADLNDSGYFWDGEFFLPANFAVIEDGVSLYYNPYEAAAYAMGATELFVPMEGIKIR